MSKVKSRLYAKGRSRIQHSFQNRHFLFHSPKPTKNKGYYSLNIENKEYNTNKKIFKSHSVVLLLCREKLCTD